MMRLCELVRGYKTSDETLAAARLFAESIGKTCVVVSRDIAGFVTTRLISALANEAIRLVESGVATAEDVDVGMPARLRTRHGSAGDHRPDRRGRHAHATSKIYNETGDPEVRAARAAAAHAGRRRPGPQVAARASTTTDRRCRATLLDHGEPADADRPWLMRTYAGHSSATASNALFRRNLAKGQTGLSVAFDLPTQTGYDPDARARPRRGGQGRRAGRAPRRHARAARRHPAGRDEHVDDDQRHRDVAARAVRDGGRGAGRRPGTRCRARRRTTSSRSTCPAARTSSRPGRRCG